MTKKVDKFAQSTPAFARHRAKLARKAAEALMLGFAWSEAKEGGEYWDKIHNRLGEIAYAFDRQAINIVTAKQNKKALTKKLVP